ncbi:choline transporter [Apiospora rasikravindrae]|uniref:Choline transporter n=1 Tax=Apiospora rasikravindrae TaxID=990691 RepID=A0ABR1TAF1_9PEZI
MSTVRNNGATPSARDKQQHSPEVRAVLRDEIVVAVEGGVEINAAGHRDQLKRQYNLWALTGAALTIDNAWAALGSSITVSIANGGPTGIVYELILAVFYYAFIGLSLAELASSVPTAGGVYHWATIAAGPRWGRMTGFFAGWINFYGWIFGLASLQQVTANVAVQMYATYHRDTYAPAAWHVYVAYVLVLWLCAACVVFANRRVVPWTQHVGMLLVVVGGIVTIVVVAAMPRQHASNQFVWASFEENNLTGWPGVVAFLLGVLNGAFTIGTPDAITHLAEELPHPRRDLPKVIGLQIGLGGLYALVFAIAIGYAITDLSVLIEPGNLNTYPLAIIYEQATGSASATLGLLLILLLSTLCCNVGTLLTCSRTYWALARDGAVPFSGLFARVDEGRSCPVPATLFVGVVATGLGAIALGSNAAFLDLSGSFIILTTVSYAIPLIANMATGRRYFPAGPFHMGRGWFGWVVNGLAVLFIVLFDVLFCFPFAIPTTTETMNYNSVILAGVVALSAIWWVVHATRHYPGPKVMRLYIHNDAVYLGQSQDGAALSGTAAEKTA